MFKSSQRYIPTHQRLLHFQLYSIRFLFSFGSFTIRRQRHSNLSGRRLLLHRKQTVHDVRNLAFVDADLLRRAASMASRQRRPLSMDGFDSNFEWNSGNFVREIGRPKPRRRSASRSRLGLRTVGLVPVAPEPHDNHGRSVASFRVRF